MTEKAIYVERVTKHFKDFKAVHNLSFEVNKATCFGLLGPNGAGKTTMMNMLTGRVRADSDNGRIINVLGYDPAKNELEIRYLTGIVPQENNLDIELSVAQNLYIYSKFYGLPHNVASRRISELLEFMELTEKKAARIRELSGGMQRRLVIARALINSPHLLILDEPTTGLDPQVRQAIWDKMRMLKKTGVTIVLTTHYMDEAAQLCDDLIIMHKGEKILQGHPSTLISKNLETYVLEILNTDVFSTIETEGLRTEKTAGRLMLYSDRLSSLETVTEPLNAGDFFLRPVNLEDLFLKVTGRTLHD
ncbi:ABC transporter ATP-binding protein [uncultured Desulfobacter sp.]|uniref:ABC transporter ATP-binding protein n=1 Tax=uncultured Desulfobacter sp. TaxID=240139 RepID=UPI002AAC1BBF|nr:ABC transporter ATP-binding protein [uncultured Desulfobacter sp.]